jgi:SAM-dependent methyltransferase
MPDYRPISEFYDAEYADQAILKQDVGFFLAQAGDEALDVLEIGCGTGRAAVPIACQGHRVVGFDVDEAMLDIAAERGREAQLDERRLRLLAADATDPQWPKRLGSGRFDVCCCFFNTFLAFGSPESQEICLSAARSVLKPGGRLWLDVFNPNLELIAGSIGGADELEPTLFALPDGRSVMRLTKLKASTVRQVTQVTFDYEWFERGRRRRRSRRFEMAWIMPRELERLLRICSFRIEQVWGDYDGSALKDGSPRQIVSAVRA